MSGMSRYFQNMVEKFIHRDGIESLMNWLAGTDFYEAPASTKYHLHCKGGLCTHSCNTFDRLNALCVDEAKRNLDFHYDMESVAIIGLFHDICKTNYYSLEMRDKKVDGKWSKLPVYEIKDRFPIGHGERSVYLLNRHIKLTDEEALSIRWHMGPWTEKDYRTMQLAMEKFPMVVLMQTADLMATYIDEGERDEAR